MPSVRQILKDKGSEVWSIQPHATVYEALEMMAVRNVGALVVLEHGKVAGIFSERDYARRVALAGKSSRNTAVGDLMTRDVLYVGPDDTLETCMALMTAKRVRHLPVLDEGHLLGLVSIGDVVKEIISDREFQIRELEHYIRGSY
jgi:CBS domain-containing protein